MISQKMQDAINEQINAEMFSAYLYLSMSAYFESISLPGFAHWMQLQTQEEMTHAMKLYGFLNERMGRVTLKAIAAPQTDWKDALDVFEAALAHEQKVTGLINNLMNLADDEKDHASKGFLQWFVDEQVEEEASTDAIVQKLKMVKDVPGGVFMLDKEMAQRVASVPTEEK